MVDDICRRDSSVLDRAENQFCSTEYRVAPVSLTEAVGLCRVSPRAQPIKTLTGLEGRVTIVVCAAKLAALILDK